MDDMKERMVGMVVGGITNRVNRLKKLIEMNAPTVVLYSEIARLYEHAQMLGEGKFYAEELTRKAMALFNRRKPVFGVCSEDGCWEECFSECEAEGVVRCAGCHERFLAESAQMEREIRESMADREGGDDGDDD